MDSVQYSLETVLALHDGVDIVGKRLRVERFVSRRNEHVRDVEVVVFACENVQVDVAVARQAWESWVLP